MDLSLEAVFALIGAGVGGYGAYKRDVLVVGIAVVITALALFFTIAVAG